MTRLASAVARARTRASPGVSRAGRSRLFSATTVEKRSLRIRGPKGPKGKTPTYKVTITMPALGALAISGLSNVHVAKLSSKDISVAVDGAATLDIAGASDSLSLAVSGAAQLKLADLKVHECALQVSGIASGSLRADRSLSVMLSGTATLDLYGKPQITKQVSGTLELHDR